MTALLTIAEAADYLGLSESGLRKIIYRSKNQLARGQLAELKFSQHGQGKIMFRREWLDEYIDTGVASPSVVPVAQPLKEKRRAVVLNAPQFDHGF